MNRFVLHQTIKPCNKIMTAKEKSIYKPKRIFFWVTLLFLIAIVIISFFKIENHWLELFSNFQNIVDLIKEFFAWSSINFADTSSGTPFGQEVFKFLLQTLEFSFLGTILGACISIPMAIIASTNIVKFKPINYVMKVILAIFRTLPIFFMSIIILWFIKPRNNVEFITIMCAAFFTLSSTSKMIYDKIEETQMGTFLFLEGIGLTKQQAFSIAIWPQIYKFVISTVLFAFETNVRYLSVIALTLGVGISGKIQDYINNGEFNKAGFICFVLIMTIFIIEMCAWLIKKKIAITKDKVINVRYGKQTNWTIKCLNLLPNKIYRNYLTDSTIIFGWMKYRFERRKIVHRRTILKINNKASDKLQSLQEELIELKQMYLTTKKSNTFKNKQAITIEESLFQKNEFIQTIKQEINWFFAEQTKVLTTDYMMNHKPKTWIKNIIFFALIITIFIILVSKVTYSNENKINPSIGLGYLKNLLSPSWGTFFGHNSSYIGPVEMSAFDLIVESIIIAILGTFIGMIIGLVLGALSSKNVTGKYVSKPFWIIATFIRPTPSYIYAYFMIVLVPIGPFAGVLALSLSSAGMLAKYIRESFDEVDMKIVLNLTGIGYNRFQVFIHGIMPQVNSRIISWALYRFDINVREVATLGVVSAGSLGTYITKYNSAHNYHDLGTIIYTLVITCLLIEVIISTLRMKVLYDKNIKLYNMFIKWVDQKKMPLMLILWELKQHEDGTKISNNFLKTNYFQTIKNISKTKRKIKPTEIEYKQISDDLSIKSRVKNLKLIKAMAIEFNLIEFEQVLSYETANEIIKINERINSEIKR